MFMQVVIWTDREAQANGWDNFEATGYAEEIKDENIYLPAVGEEELDAPERDDVQGEKFTGVVGSISHDRLYTGEAQLIRAADGTVWVDFDAYVEAAM